MEKRAILVLVILLLFGSGLKIYQNIQFKRQVNLFIEKDSKEKHSENPIEEDPLTIKAIDLNTCSKFELEELPGIGPVKATAIIKYRNENGKFFNINDLIEIPGIGPGIIERIKSLIHFSDSTSGNEKK